MIEPRFVSFWRNVGIVGGGISVAGAILLAVSTFGWQIAMRPFYDRQTIILERLEILDARQRAVIDVLAAENPSDLLTAKRNLYRVIIESSVSRPK